MRHHTQQYSLLNVHLSSKKFAQKHECFSKIKPFRGFQDMLTTETKAMIQDTTEAFCRGCCQDRGAEDACQTGEKERDRKSTQRDELVKTEAEFQIIDTVIMIDVNKLLRMDSGASCGSENWCIGFLCEAAS